MTSYVHIHIICQFSWIYSFPIFIPFLITLTRIQNPGSKNRNSYLVPNRKKTFSLSPLSLLLHLKAKDLSCKSFYQTEDAPICAQFPERFYYESLIWLNTFSKSFKIFFSLILLMCWTTVTDFQCWFSTIKLLFHHWYIHHVHSVYQGVVHLIKWGAKCSLVIYFLKQFVYDWY